MNHIFRAVGVGVFCLCLCWIATAPAAAQDMPGNESSTSEIYEQLGDLTIESVDYSGGRFEISLRWTGDLTQEVSLTELVELEGSGSSNINIKQQRLRPGQSTTVSISADKSGGTAAIILSSEQSLSNGNALVIQSGEPTSREPVPFDIAILAVGASAGVSVLVSLVLVVRRKNEEDKGRERIA